MKNRAFLAGYILPLWVITFSLTAVFHTSLAGAREISGTPIADQCDVTPIDLSNLELLIDDVFAGPEFELTYPNGIGITLGEDELLDIEIDGTDWVVNGEISSSVVPESPPDDVLQSVTTTIDQDRICTNHGLRMAVHALKTEQGLRQEIAFWKSIGGTEVMALNTLTSAGIAESGIEIPPRLIASTWQIDETHVAAIVFNRPIPDLSARLNARLYILALEDERWLIDSTTQGLVNPLTD